MITNFLFLGFFLILLTIFLGIFSSIKSIPLKLVAFILFITLLPSSLLTSLSFTSFARPFKYVFMEDREFELVSYHTNMISIWLMVVFEGDEYPRLLVVPYTEEKEKKLKNALMSSKVRNGKAYIKNYENDSLDSFGVDIKIKNNLPPKNK